MRRIEFRQTLLKSSDRFFECAVKFASRCVLMTAAVEVTHSKTVAREAPDGSQGHFSVIRILANKYREDDSVDVERHIHETLRIARLIMVAPKFIAREGDQGGLLRRVNLHFFVHSVPHQTHTRL